MAKMWLALTAKNIRSRPWLQPGTLRDETSLPESRQKTLNREMSCWKREERTDLIWPLASPQKIKLWSEARETTLEVKVGRCSIFTWFTNISSSKTMANLQRNRIEAKKYCNQAKILKRPVQYFEMQWKCNHGPKRFSGRDLGSIEPLVVQLRLQPSPARPEDKGFGCEIYFVIT